MRVYLIQSTGHPATVLTKLQCNATISQHAQIQNHLFPYLPHPVTPISQSVSLTRPPHITINRETKRRKARTPQRRSLRARRRRQHTAGNTTGHDAILQIVFRAEAFDAAFRACEDGADLAEVARAGVGACSQVFEALSELLA
jgi:hypothetical protein